MAQEKHPSSRGQMVVDPNAGSVRSSCGMWMDCRAAAVVLAG